MSTPSRERPMHSRAYPWYDSQWLTAYSSAIETMRRVAPGRLAEFEHAFDVLRTPPAFTPSLCDTVFDAVTMDEIRHVAATLEPARLELHEARAFRRFVVHDHPFFDALQQRTLALVSEAAGEPVEASYNFLSLYGPQGVCPLHMDAPQAKWTLDLCVSQSQPWPIHFSPVVPWPKPGDYDPDWEAAIKREVGSRFTSFTLQPGQAVLFAGSSQWHYRDPMPAAGPSASCDLLFFHFIPSGTRELVDPANWARMFGIDELRQDALAAA